jgi:hypothetical protein
MLANQIHKVILKFSFTYLIKDALKVLNIACHSNKLINQMQQFYKFIT